MGSSIILGVNPIIIRKRAAWIIEWELHRRALPIRDLHPYILPPRWRNSRVKDFMRCWFWNSALWSPWETLERVSQLKPQALLERDGGTKIIYGMSTALVACHTRDLFIEEESSGKCVMEWTRIRGILL